MAIFTATAQIPQLTKPVITIGSFDGVHLGHQRILELVAKRAAEIDGESMLVTFEPHPRKYLQPGVPMQLLTPLQEKLPLLQHHHIEHVLVVHFDAHLAQLSASAYIEELLYKSIRPHTIIVGYDHRYGKDRAGNLELLYAKGKELGFAVEELPAQMIDNAAVSSSRIRKALHEGNLDEVNSMLGRYYTLKGKVIHGKQLGRQLGYPTANLRLCNPDQLIPAKGVYAVRVLLNEIVILGMMNIGYRPTIDEEKQLHIEVNLFDWQEDIYGQIIQVDLIQYLRPEQKFNNLQELKAQLKKDEVCAKEVLA